nr:hypothetical protein [Tanacetum cinerariifolium]
METKDILSLCSNLEEQKMQQIQDKAKRVAWVSRRQIQTKEKKVHTSKALNASLVDTKSSGIESGEQDTRNRSGNDAHADNADIRPIYDKESMAETEDQNGSLIKQLNKKTLENVDLKAQIQEKVFATTTLKNELIKLKGTSVDTKFAKPPVLGKPVLQPHINQAVVRQPTAFKSERPRISKALFASQFDVNNDLSKPVTTHYMPKLRESTVIKTHHVIVSRESGSLGDKIICDLDKTPDLSQRSFQNCPKCGNPVDGQYCQGCALLRRNIRKICLHIVLKMEFSKILLSHLMTIPTLLMLFKSHSLSNKTPEHNSCYDPNSFGFDQFQSSKYSVNHPIFNAQNDLFNFQNKLMEKLTSMCDMVGQYIQKKEEEKQIKEEQAAKVRYWKIPACYDDDDDDDYTIAITHKEPDNSLSMGDEHIDTVSVTKSDEFIKSSVENFVPIPSESEGEHACDVPACEDFTTFSNILFDADYDFYSSDDQSFYDEDLPKEIYSNPLFDEEFISMKIDPHHFNAE